MNDEVNYLLDKFDVKINIGERLLYTGDMLTAEGVLWNHEHPGCVVIIWDDDHNGHYGHSKIEARLFNKRSGHYSSWEGKLTRIEGVQIHHQFVF